LLAGLPESMAATPIPAPQHANPKRPALTIKIEWSEEAMDLEAWIQRYVSAIVVAEGLQPSSTAATDGETA
jgi:hypothetical protein